MNSRNQLVDFAALRLGDRVRFRHASGEVLLGVVVGEALHGAWRAKTAGGTLHGVRPDNYVAHKPGRAGGRCR